MAGDDQADSLTDVDALLAEAASTPVDGWDLSRFGDRLVTSGPPWDFAAIVARACAGAESLLDLGTGGGEWLAALPSRPPRTVATESWPPNVPVARARLAPLGVDVVATEGAPDNVDQNGDEPALPFADASFAVVCARHESYVPSEVARVLAPGGVFVTQQVGGDYRGFRDLLGLDRGAPSRWTQAFATQQLEAAGLEVVDGAEGVERVTFADVGALAWYLRAIPWVVPGYEIAMLRARPPLLPATVEQPAFWLEARGRRS